MNSSVPSKLLEFYAEFKFCYLCLTKIFAKDSSLELEKIDSKFS